MVVMKRIYFIILSLLLTLSIFAQSGKEVNLNIENNEIRSRFNIRKEKGFYNIMQVGFMFGNSQLIDRTSYYGPNYSNFTDVAPAPGVYDAHSTVYYLPYPRSILTVAPSFTITNGYRFNEHWAAGVGVGFEIFDHNLFPLFTELRYTLWDNRISPFVVVKGGYSFGSFKTKHYDDLYLNWSPYYVNDAGLRHYGGLMFHPEIGIKVPVNEYCDLMFTTAYCYQKTKSVARKDYTNGQFDEWEHNENINRLSFGVAIMFR
jgi:hypothetical protein